MSNYFLAIIAGCGLVTWLPRVVPFILSKKVDFPKWLQDFLSYIPICILTALLLQSILTYREGQLPLIKPLELAASIPALLVAVKTKDLMKTVIVAMVTIAVFRWLF